MNPAILLVSLGEKRADSLSECDPNGDPASLSQSWF